MATASQAPATLDDLYRVEGKAELIGGRIVRYMATGHRPNRVAGRIFRSLDDFADRIGRGTAYTDSMGFAVGPLSSGPPILLARRVLLRRRLARQSHAIRQQPPTLAVEVRSEGDYSASAEIAMAAKRRDYFEAGTRVVWDVDPVAETIAVHRATDPDSPTTYRRGQSAEAEEAAPGWRVEVDWIFRP